MKKEDFFEVLGELDDDIVKGAKTTMKKKTNWKVWGTMAACLAVVIMASAAFLPIIRTEPNPRKDDPVPEIVADIKNITIYYLSENGAIEHEIVELNCTPKDIFNEWATLNNISDVSFIKCVYDDGGSEKQQGNMVEHTTGNHFTLDLTVSAEFSSYVESERGDLLVQSLRQTFCDYISIDDFNLIIDN